MKKADFGREPEENESLSSLKNQRHLTPQAAGAAQEFIAEHTVKDGETLSHIALKYYNSTAQEKWMAIYQANKAVIGDNPSIVRPGAVLKIPKLPA